MTKQEHLSQFLKQSTQSKIGRTSYTALTKRRLRWFGLVNLLLVLLVSGPSLDVWNTQVVYAQATSQSSAVDSTGRVAVIGVEPAPLYTTPGGATLQTLTPGTPVTVTGRSQDSQWLQVDNNAGSKGWMAANQLIVFGVDELPVLAVANVAAPVQTTATTTSTAVTQTITTTTAVPVTNTVAPVQTAEPVITTTTPVTDNVQTSDTTTVTVTAAGLNVRAGPGTNYPVIVKAKAGQIYPAQARNVASTWLQVTLPAQQFGWVAAQYVKLDRAVSALPVSDRVSAAPVSQPTPTAISTAGTEPPLQTAYTAAVNQPVQKTSTTNGPSASAATGLQGTLVFETSNGGAIYIYKLATGALRQLTSGFDPAISPDGSKVAFTRIGGENGVYVINSDGSNEHKIYSGNQTLSSPKWSPDGNWIVFSQVAATYTCYQMGSQCLTYSDLKKRLPASQANDPKALKKLLSNPDIEVNQNPLWGIARVDVNGQEYRDLVALNSARSPDWSNSGIVYQSADGLQKTADKPDAVNQLVLGEHYVQDPDWQPNGGRIVYQSRQGPHWEIFTINDDCSGEVALTHPETTLVDQLPSNVAPAWSPDGQHIVFLSNRQDNHEAGAWRIWVMNADGSNQHPLPINVQIEYGYTDEQMVSWGG
jgi:TolB protein